MEDMSGMSLLFPQDRWGIDPCRSCRAVGNEIGWVGAGYGRKALIVRERIFG